MGWFWADETALSRPGVPPPGCPAHAPRSEPPAACPISRPASSSKNQQADTTPSNPSPTCPVATKAAATPSATQKGSSRSTIEALNPLNYMPSNLSQKRESALQKIALPIERETSSIPRLPQSGGPHAGEPDERKWVYPSPQQMYNALVRKGHTDTPADAVEAMVAVHNFLNEGAWAEIVEWERRFSRGLSAGWELSRYGEDGSRTGAMIEPEALAAQREEDEPRLLRFMGRADDMTPKARWGQLLGWAAPSWYAGPAPFDRHDWYVERQSRDGKSTEKRYVIDYYSAGEEATGEPVFYLDIRPALDGPTAAAERLIRWSRDVWWRASGGQARVADAQR